MLDQPRVSRARTLQNDATCTGDARRGEYVEEETVDDQRHVFPFFFDLFEGKKKKRSFECSWSHCPRRSLVRDEYGRQSRAPLSLGSAENE